MTIGPGVDERFPPTTFDARLGGPLEQIRRRTRRAIPAVMSSGRQRLTRACRGCPAMAPMSERFRLRAFLPSRRTGVQSRLKWTPSTMESVVASTDAAHFEHRRVVAYTRPGHHVPAGMRCRRCFRSCLSPTALSGVSGDIDGGRVGSALRTVSPPCRVARDLEPGHKVGTLRAALGFLDSEACTPRGDNGLPIFYDVGSRFLKPSRTGQRTALTS